MTLPYTLMKTEIMKEIIQHVREHDKINERNKYNFVKKIQEETGWSHSSVVKCIQILEEWDLIERKKDGRKKIIHYSPYNGHRTEELE